MEVDNIVNNATKTKRNDDDDDDGPPAKEIRLESVESGQSENSPAGSILSLPIEVLVKIFKYLDFKTISNCASVCRRFNEVTKHGSLYINVSLKYTMNQHFLESYVSKISLPQKLHIEYKYCDQNTAEVEENKEFNKHVEKLLQKCGESLFILEIESCYYKNVLSLISECTNLKTLGLYRCKGFSPLSTIKTLNGIKFIQNNFPPKFVADVIRNNCHLREIFLGDNVNVNINEVCETLSQHKDVQRVHLSERKKLTAKSLKALSRLTKLKKLELISCSGVDCDPEDSLEYLAAGCSQLESLTIHGRKEINDDNLIPALHNCTNLKKLDLGGVNITIKSCREAALSLPRLKILDVIKCSWVKKAQLAKLQEDFSEICIPL